MLDDMRVSNVMREMLEYSPHDVELKKDGRSCAATQSDLHRRPRRRCWQPGFHWRACTSPRRFGAGTLCVLSQSFCAIARGRRGRRWLWGVVTRIVRWRVGACLCVRMRSSRRGRRRWVVVVCRAVRRSCGCSLRLTIRAACAASSIALISSLNPRRPTRRAPTIRPLSSIRILPLVMLCRRRVGSDTRRRPRLGIQPLVEDRALETHALDVALDAERLEMKLVVLHLDLAHLLLELLVLETVLGRVTLDGDRGRVGFRLGLDWLRCGRWCRHGCCRATRSVSREEDDGRRTSVRLDVRAAMNAVMA